MGRGVMAESGFSCRAKFDVWRVAWVLGGFGFEVFESSVVVVCGKLSCGTKSESRRSIRRRGFPYAGELR